MPQVKSFYFQAKAIFVKNMLCSLRNKEIYTEIFLPIIAALFVSLKDKDPSMTLLIFSPILISLAAYSNPRSLLIHLVEYIQIINSIKTNFSILKKKSYSKPYSSVVLTTHTMDEAESLCDRIAIMINGELYCLGSPKELKDRYGEGYNVQLKGCDNGDLLLQSIQQLFPSSRRIADTSEDYYTVHIPTQEFKFYRVFDLMMEFEKQKQIHDFSINQSSLESVFIQFSRLQQQVSYT